MLGNTGIQYIINKTEQYMTHIQQFDFLPNLYPGQPWLALVTLDQGSTLASPGKLWSRATKVNQGLPWSALVSSGPG